MKKIHRLIAVAAIGAVSAFGLTACGEKTNEQKAEDIEQDAKDAAEDAKSDAEDALEDLKDE